LAVLAGRLAEDLEKYDVELHSDNEPPENLRGSELVIIGAHGGLAEDGQYFRVVADDAGASVTAARLSKVLADVGVVVLFVCSGGRIDSYPGANTTVGLAKQLLNNGCRAVVAPAWPLSVQVPSKSLPAFLRYPSDGGRGLI
jgi:hypothetical protein